MCNILYDEEEVEEVFLSLKQLLRLHPAVCSIALNASSAWVTCASVAKRSVGCCLKV